MKNCILLTKDYLLGFLDYFGNYKPVIPYDEEKYDLFRKLFGYDSLDIYRNAKF
jgi:hypothetical protein